MNLSRIYGYILLVIIALVLASCAPAPEKSVISPTAAPNIRLNPSTLAPEISLSNGTYYGLTYQRSDGTRRVDGKGSLPDGQPQEISLGGSAAWLVATPFQEGSLWTVAHTDGNLESFYLNENTIEPVDLERGPLPPGAPPLVLVQDDQAYLVAPPTPQASNLTHPVVIDPESGEFLFITEAGDLVVWQHGLEVKRLAVNALPDARMVQDDEGRLLLLSDPTDRYDHGVLGDKLEAGSITLVRTTPSLEIINKIEIPTLSVIEGIAPMWVDLDGDGRREIIVTISDVCCGARLVVFNEEGDMLAEGPVAGQIYRWRHQISAAPLGPNGVMMIVDVLRPHLDATLEFLSWEGNRLVLKASLPGYSSHGIGSRNLDMALVGDFNGNGFLEVVVPDLSQESLTGIEFLGNEALLAWTVPLGGKLTSNLAGVSLNDGSLVLGAGVGEKLLIWGQ